MWAGGPFGAHHRNETVSASAQMRSWAPVDMRQAFRFLLVGGLNTSVGYAFYAALVIVGLPLWLCVAGATALALFFNFFSYGALVFGTTGLRRLPRFLMFYAVLGLVNFLLLRVLGWAGFGPLLAQALVLPLLAAAGYLGMRRLIFDRKPGAAAGG